MHEIAGMVCPRCRKAMRLVRTIPPLEPSGRNPCVLLCTVPARSDQTGPYSSVGTTAELRGRRRLGDDTLLRGGTRVRDGAFWNHALVLENVLRSVATKRPRKQ